LTAKRPNRVLRKLVRDKIPEEIVSEGRRVRRLEVLGSLRDSLLRRKAYEEVVELCDARGVDSVKEELADIFEILHALAAEHRIPLDEIESIRIAKRAARGGFDNGVFIDYIAKGESTPQMGLFGPMDYVSVTKRTPHANEIRMEEESLLRIPLVPSLYLEEFRVGIYIVTFTDREILVRIRPSSDDRQLFLFEPDHDFFDLAQSPQTLLELLPKFEGLWKIYSHIWLKAFGFPVPASVIVRDLTPTSQKGIHHFCARGRHKNLLLRHDRDPEIQNPPRCGYLFSVRNLARELIPFIAQKRTLMLQEPLSPYNDLYSCNASVRRNSTHATLEIVGPGFDASDLNRGDVTPHEVWDIVCDPGSDSDLPAAKQTSLVDQATYERSVRKRLNKIGRRVTGEFAVGLKKAADEKPEEFLIESALKYLRTHAGSLLLKHSKRYSPIQTSHLLLFAKALRELFNHQESGVLQWREEIIVSMSIVPPERLVIWQIVWPERQIYREPEAE
jgi:predicted house-cleaning noncanonical NTP pyrophosphatase (MazG superfamily)